jgi:hypothetical protein
MEINKYVFGKNHGKLFHGRNLAPKTFFDLEQFIDAKEKYYKEIYTRFSHN